MGQVYMYNLYLLYQLTGTAFLPSHPRKVIYDWLPIVYNTFYQSRRSLNLLDPTYPLCHLYLETLSLHSYLLLLG